MSASQAGRSLQRGTSLPARGQGLPYVLVTPARNEAQFIEGTIHSVIRQTVLPAKWVIVSDGSTDGTDEIVKKYVAQYPWIELVRMPETRDRNFGAKVQCFNAGRQRIRPEEYEIIGNLDADITFEEGYLAFLLGKFIENPKLGVAGTPFVEGQVSYDFRYANLDHVSGACQLFRRRCFEEIGGYTPIRGGGIDWVAVTTARMKGWKTRTFTEMVCHHHRPMGTAASNRWGAWFRLGRQEYYLGNHPLWEFLRSCFQMRNKPYIVGGILLFAGYAWAGIRRIERPISRELLRFQRGEQMKRLGTILRGGRRGAPNQENQGGNDG